MDKYEYLTGEDLRYKPGVVEKVKFEYSPLGEALNNKVKGKTDKRNKVVNTDKQDKNLIYNLQHSFVKLKKPSDFKELLLNSMHKKLMISIKKFTGLKNVSPQKKPNEDLQANVLDNVGDIFNELYYIYKEIHVEEKDALNKKDTKKFNYTKLRLADNYQCESKKEEKQTDIKHDKKEAPKKPTRIDAKEFSELIIKKETGINRELFQKYFSFQIPTAMLKAIYNTNTKKKTMT